MVFRAWIWLEICRDFLIGSKIVPSTLFNCSVSVGIYIIFSSNICKACIDNGEVGLIFKKYYGIIVVIRDGVEAAIIHVNRSSVISVIEWRYLGFKVGEGAIVNGNIKVVKPKRVPQ